jgi:hypothetical protein
VLETSLADSIASILLRRYKTQEAVPHSAALSSVGARRNVVSDGQAQYGPPPATVEARGPCTSAAARSADSSSRSGRLVQASRS